VTEDIEHQNQQSKEKFIMGQCIPQLNKAVKKALQKKAFAKNEEGMITIKLLEKELAQAVYPEFLSFVAFFRAKLLRYCLHQEGQTSFTRERLSAWVPKITFKDKQIRQDIMPTDADPVVRYTYKNKEMALYLHEAYDFYT
jgi:hypothetical protein